MIRRAMNSNPTYFMVPQADLEPATSLPRGLRLKSHLKVENREADINTKEYSFTKKKVQRVKVVTFFVEQKTIQS
jgi:hypothetical protein